MIWREWNERWLRQGSYWANTWASTPAYNLGGISYDRSDNLKTLQRYDESGSPVDDLSYGYASTSNRRLATVSDAAGATA